MKIWWCQEHLVGDGDPNLFKRGQEVIACYVGDTGYGGVCRMVPMRLIPDNARWFIEREQGQRVAGPFTTEDDANYARTWVEKVLTPETFWIRLDGETP